MGSNPYKKEERSGGINELGLDDFLASSSSGSIDDAVWARQPTAARAGTGASRGRSMMGRGGRGMGKLKEFGSFGRS